MSASRGSIGHKANATPDKDSGMVKANAGDSKESGVAMIGHSGDRHVHKENGRGSVTSSAVRISANGRTNRVITSGSPWSRKVDPASDRIGTGISQGNGTSGKVNGSHSNVWLVNAMSNVVRSAKAAHGMNKTVRNRRNKVVTVTISW